MLQNVRVTAFTVFELLRENQQRGVILPLSPPRLGLKRLMGSIAITLNFRIPTDTPTQKAVQIQLYTTYNTLS